MACRNHIERSFIAAMRLQIRCDLTKVLGSQFIITSHRTDAIPLCSTTKRLFVGPDSCKPNRNARALHWRGNKARLCHLPAFSLPTNLLPTPHPVPPLHTP